MYAADAERAAANLNYVRALGVSRRQVFELVGLTAAQTWRCEQGRVNEHEVELITKLVDLVAEGACALPVRRLSERDARVRLAAVESLLDDACALRAADLRAVVRECLSVIRKP